MALQVIKRELNPLRWIRPYTLIFWRLPVQVIKQEALEMSIGAMLFLYCMKLYYRFLRWIAPLLQRFNPRLFRQLHFRISFFFYEKIVPPPNVLLQTGLHLYRKM
jgi:hypothetical protein